MTVFNTRLQVCLGSCNRNVMLACSLCYLKTSDQLLLHLNICSLYYSVVNTCDVCHIAKETLIVLFCVFICNDCVCVLQYVSQLGESHAKAVFSLLYKDVLTSSG